MTDIVEELLDFTTRDHERGCTGREYVCSCGYDNDIEAAVKKAAGEIARLRLSLSEARATGRREGMEERRLCAIDLWNQLVVLSGYHITRPPTPDHEFVQVCNGDLRKMIELMGRMYQPTTVGEQRPDNLDVDRFSYAIRAAMEKAE